MSDGHNYKKCWRKARLAILLLQKKLGMSHMVILSTEHLLFSDTSYVWIIGQENIAVKKGITTSAIQYTKVCIIAYKISSHIHDYGFKVRWSSGAKTLVTCLSK